jgi:predicted MFS family arabinose efflux permease
MITITSPDRTLYGIGITIAGQPIALVIGIGTLTFWSPVFHWRSEA